MFWEIFTHALQTTGIGMGTTFTVLIVLWAVLVLLKFLLNTLPQKMQRKKNAEAAPAEVAAPVQVSMPAPAYVSAPAAVQAPVSGGGEIAAIAAAVSAYTGIKPSGLVVRSVVRRR